MGAGQSKQETVFTHEVPVQFSQDLTNHLADNLADPSPSPSRQTTLDAHVRSRIQTELERLRAEEEDVRSQIQTALQKENLDREREVVEEEGALSSTALLGDIAEIERKVGRYEKRREIPGLDDLRSKGEAVAKCYRSRPERTLDCWREVAQFKALVAQTEQDLLETSQ